MTRSAKRLPLHTDQKKGRWPPPKGSGPGEAEKDYLRRSDGAASEALTDVGRMSASVRVNLFPESNVIVVVLPEQHLGDAAGAEVVVHQHQ